MVAVPALLLNESQVHDLVLDLEIRFLANRDPNLYFALLTDSPDSDQQRGPARRFGGRCRRLIEGLNRRYASEGRSPFFLLHRHRAYNESEGCWMGWERKRGKLLDLNRLFRGGRRCISGEGGRHLRCLPRGALCDYSGCRYPIAPRFGGAAHRSHRAPAQSGRDRSALQNGCRRATGFFSRASASAFNPRPAAAWPGLYSGQTGFDIYTRAVSDVYQDLFGEGIFTGKGIYEVETLSEVLEGRFPENALLSHDLIEGAYARAALVSDVELIDDYPSHFSGYCRRKHRWVRGDWQILRWMLGRVSGRSAAE